MNEEQRNYFWNKLSFILYGDDGDGNDEEGYRNKLYEVLMEILIRLDKLEKKSHIHKFQLPEYKEKWKQLGKDKL